MAEKLKKGQKITEEKLKELGWKETRYSPNVNEIVYERGKEGLVYDFIAKKIVRLY